MLDIQIRNKKFGELRAGEVFIVKSENEGHFMKLWERYSPQNDSWVKTAVNLEEATIVSFSTEEEVIVVNATLTITY